MQRERMELTVKEIDRLKVIDQVIKRQLKAREAADQLSISVRQVRRLKKRIGQGGYKAIIHGLRGKPSNRCLPEGLLEAALAQIVLRYSDFGPTFANEKLTARDGFQLSTSSLRRAMMAAGIWKARKQKIQYRACRERKACLGELVQLDGSDHQWFEERGERCVLITFIDDATSRILHAEFAKVEDTMTLLSVARNYLLKCGRPLAFYVDRDSIYKVNREATIEEQLRDSKPMTQFTRAMKELNIEVISANSPQAKGRVERGFKTHQDRLVKELRLEGISTMERANQFLRKSYILAHNRRFSVQPHSKTNAHRPLLPSHRLDQILSLRIERTVNNDYTVRVNNFFMQILPGRRIRPTDRVFVEVRLDGSIHLRFKRTYLRYKFIEKCLPPPGQDLPISFRKSSKPPFPTEDHPWRHFFLSKKSAIERYQRNQKLREGSSLPAPLPEG